jgi:hypothetical protein
MVHFECTSHTSWNKWSDWKFGVNNEILMRVMNDFSTQTIVEWTDYFQKESGPPS